MGSPETLAWQAQNEEIIGKLRADDRELVENLLGRLVPRHCDFNEFSSLEKPTKITVAGY